MKAQFRYAIEIEKINWKWTVCPWFIFWSETTCPQCGIVCRQQESVEQHIKTVHEGRM